MSMSMTPETPTPETDAFKRTVGTVWHDFAGKLERERNAARAEIDAMREAIKEAHEAFDELWNLSFDVPWATSEKAEATLAKLKPFIKP